MRTFREMALAEKIKKKTVKIKKHGNTDVDFSEILVYLSSDDLISIAFDNGESDVSFGADYYSWMDDDIQLTIKTGKNKVVLESHYDEDKDESSWFVVTGSPASKKMVKQKIYGSSKDVCVLGMSGNTADVTITAKALIED